MNLSEKNRRKKIVKQEKKRKKRKENRVEELERKTEEKMIQKKELRKKIKEKLSFTTEKYRKEADRKITESVLELNRERNGYIFYIARYSSIRKASWSAKVYGKRNYERIRDPLITRAVSGCIWNS